MATINNIEVNGEVYELGGLTNIPIIEQTLSNVEIQPNVLNKWGEILYLNITLAQPTDTTIVNEYMIQFKSGNIETSISLPENITWIQPPYISRNATYQISIVDNCAVFGEFIEPTNEVIPYTQVEYLQSDSTAYINTGLNPDDDDIDIYVEFMWSKYVQYGAIFGNYVSGGTNSMYRLILNTETQIVSNHNTIENTNTGSGYFNANINTKYKLQVSKNSFILNNEVIQRGGVTKGEKNTTNIALFNRSIAEPITRDIELKIYSFIVMKQGVKLMQMVPVVVDGIGYMYDTVSGRLFGNEGTGSFVLGPTI